MNHRIFILSIFFISSSLFATIVEHSEFSAILNYLSQEDYHKNTVIVLDIDNTIAIQGHPFEMFGGDMWVNYEINKLVKEGLTFQDALAQILPFYYELTHYVELEPVESATAEIIKQLQDAGITVIACTIRSLPVSDRTIMQLKSIDIDLSRSSFGDQELLGTDITFRYKDGIIFCNGGDKGVTLKCIFDHFNHTPTKVIVIDDKEKYLHQIKKVLHADIEFIGIRYGHLDDKVANFDPVLAEQEKKAYMDAPRDGVRSPIPH